MHLHFHPIYKVAVTFSRLFQTTFWSWWVLKFNNYRRRQHKNLQNGLLTMLKSCYVYGKSEENVKNFYHKLLYPVRNTLLPLGSSNQIKIYTLILQRFNNRCDWIWFSSSTNYNIVRDFKIGDFFFPLSHCYMKFLEFLCFSSSKQDTHK